LKIKFFKNTFKNVPVVGFVYYKIGLLVKEQLTQICQEKEKELEKDGEYLYLETITVSIPPEHMGEDSEDELTDVDMEKKRRK